MPSLNEFATRKLAELETRGQRRELVDTGRGMAGRATRDGRDVISFCCNDYLNLSQHPQVKAAAAEALETYGAGTGASRLVTGNNPLFAELEARLARIKGAEAALIFGSGYLANTGIIPSLLGEGDIIFADELSHACIISGARMSRARVVIFRHNDMAHLRSLLAAHRADGANALVVTDGVFSMDGDLAPLPEMTALAEAHDAWLMTDDAHGLGVIGGGRGSSFAFGPQKMNVPLQMGTLSKAVGGYGGYLCADQPVIDLLKSRARTLVYSTGLPPASVAAALAVQQAAPALKNAKGSVVLFSTIAVQQGFPNHAIVASAKGAVEGLGRALAADLAPDIRVNVVAPSLMKTNMAAPIVSSDAMAEGIAKLHPIPRLGEAADAANLAAFLLSPDSPWITGQVMRVDGGRSHLRTRG